MLFELKKKTNIENRALILADRGFYSLNNYLTGYIINIKLFLALFLKKKPSLINVNIEDYKTL
jgi:hypothetical protein